MRGCGSGAVDLGRARGRQERAVVEASPGSAPAASTLVHAVPEGPHDAVWELPCLAKACARPDAEGPDRDQLAELLRQGRVVTYGTWCVCVCVWVVCPPKAAWLSVVLLNAPVVFRPRLPSKTR